MRALVLIAAIGCAPVDKSPEYLAARDYVAAWRIAAHRASCSGQPIPEYARPDCAETHDPGVRCLTLAAEAYAVCVTCCACHDDHGACESVYDLDVARCGDAAMPACNEARMN